MMTKTWTPDKRDYSNRKGSGELLSKALKLARKRAMRSLRDDKGIYAYELRNTFLVAKKELYGNIVSIHYSLLKRAWDKEKQIVMYIESENTFYNFDPQEILDQKLFNNHKDGEEMINFNIKLGRRIN